MRIFQKLKSRKFQDLSIPKYCLNVMIRKTWMLNGENMQNLVLYSSAAFKKENCRMQQSNGSSRYAQEHSSNSLQYCNKHYIFPFNRSGFRERKSEISPLMNIFIEFLAICFYHNAQFCIRYFYGDSFVFLLLFCIRYSTVWYWSTSHALYCFTYYFRDIQLQADWK